MADRLRRALARLFRRPAVTGPTPIYVRRIPGGAVLDVEHYLTRVITSIADDPDLLATLLEIADERGAATGYDGHRPESLLVERLSADLGYELPLYGGEVARLADRLRDVTPMVSVPAQRAAEGGAA
ncbi:hypothetical protein [Streptomyces antimycoticus]|uniref:hypothetical protein n=1 Tax=Streptomyces antimycoticus TaxID=68175 RepID=UPI000A39DC5B|nr:hypothetical protein [Streptomyces antimycoticus]